jgi:hypothetical protein
MSSGQKIRVGGAHGIVPELAHQNLMQIASQDIRQLTYFRSLDYE